MLNRLLFRIATKDSDTALARRTCVKKKVVVVIQCFEVSCPADINVKAKENEKVRKYLPLLSDMRQ